MIQASKKKAIFDAAFDWLSIGFPLGFPLTTNGRAATDPIRPKFLPVCLQCQMKLFFTLFLFLSFFLGLLGKRKQVQHDKYLRTACSDQGI